MARALKHAEGCSASEADGSIWNFAFGSNVNAAKVKSRGMRPVESLRGVLPAWSLLFNHNGGYGNIETITKIRSSKYDLSRLPEPMPEETHGVLLRLSRREFAELAWQEYAYDTVEVAVEIYPDDCNGAKRVQHALAFKTSACALTTTRQLPSSRYMKLIAEGAHDSKLSAPYCSWLDRIKPDH